MTRKIAFSRYFSLLQVRFRAELSELSDWTLRDIGLARRAVSLEAVKPFWMV